MNKNEMFELTTPQKSIWMMEQFYKGTNINNICATLTINMDVDMEKLNKAINIFVQNNKSFGLNFKVQNGKIKQYFTKLEDMQFEQIKLKDEAEVKKLAIETTEEIFDIEGKRLFTFKLYKLENGHGGYVVMTHHLISDAATMSIIGKETTEIYGKLIAGGEIEKKEYSYEQYILDEKEYLKSPKFEKDKQYWIENFTKVPEVATIPTTSENLCANLNGKAEREEYTLDIELFKKISGFCSQNKISNFNFFMAVYAIYLSRVSNLKDFVIGTPILNRTNFKEKHTSGMFINTAPLHIKIEENMNFISFAKKIAQSSMSMLRYQKYSYQMLLEDLRKENGNLPTLYDIMLSYQVTKANDRESKVPYKVEWLPTTTISNSIYIHLHDNDDEGTLNIAYDYQVKKYSKQDIKKINNRILHIIEQVLENKEQLEKNIEIITKEEKHKILNIFNNTATDYAKEKTIIELFEEQVNKSPENVAVIYGENQITYKELNEKANSVANYLIKQGIKKGENIPVLLERSLDLIISMIAIIKAGAVYVPISTDFPIDRIKYILKDSESKLVITSKKWKDENINVEKLYIDEFNYNKQSTENIEIKNKANDTLYIIYTSGSTGKPKGVKIANKNLNNFINTFTRNYGIINEQDKCLASTNIGFDVSIFEFFITLLNGAQLYLYEENSITDIFKYCEQIINSKITLLYIPPNILEDVYVILSKEEKIHINKMLIGVEAIKSSTIEKYYNLNPDIKIINAYGPTETTICATINVLEKSKLKKYNIIPIGKPVDNSKILILDHNLQLLPINVIGELYISGDGVGNGYLNNKEKNEKAFIKVPNLLGENIAYKTGDLAKWNEDGTISFIGRDDNQVKINGHRMELGEIENCIYEYPNVEKAIVVLDENKKINAYYTSKNKIETSKLKEFMEKNLPQYFIPTYFMQVEKFELTSNGKINRKLLPKIDVVSREIKEPTTEIQKELKEIFEKVLNEKNISIDDDFFELGGDSLSAINLTTIIYSRLNAKITITEIFNNPTIIKLEKIINSKSENKYSKIEKAKNKDKYVLSTAQKRIYYASSISEKQDTLYNITGGLILNNKIDANKLEKSINRLINNHATLRTKFELDNGEIVQKIGPKEEYKLPVEKAESDNLDKIFSDFVTPFELLNKTLYKFKLVELSNGRMFFLADFQHIISDGASLDILLRELCQIYNGEEVESEKIEYIDFSEWEYKKIQENGFKQAEEYWKKQFQDEIPTLHLPTTHKRKGEESFKGNSETKKINVKLNKSINEIANKYNCTPYMIYLAAYYILLYRYTEQKDIVVGTPISGRYLPELENVIGMFVNTLPLRSKINVEKSFRQYISETKEMCLNAFENQEYPLELINDKIEAQREDGKRRLFDTMFIFQNNGYPKFNLEGTDAKYYIPKTKVSKFDISLELMPNSEDSLDMRIEYCTDLFDKEYVENFGAHYLKILEEICQNTDIKIKDINILTEKERNLLKEFNNTEEKYLKNSSVIKEFEKQVKLHIEDNALIFKNKKITYNELNERANGLAKKLLLQDVKPKNVVGILLSRSENTIISMLAVLKTGCAYMLIDPNLPNDRINYMLSDSKAIALITEESAKYIKFKNKIFIDQNYTNCTENINIDDNIENPFSIIYTSGSTGKPKGVMLCNKGVINMVLSYQKILNVNICNNFLSMSTVSFDMFMVETMVPLLSGKTIILTTEEEQKIPVYTSRLMLEHKVDFILTTPSRIELFLANKLYECLEKTKIIQLGGEVFTLELKDRLQKCTKANLYNGYGPTEITACCSTKKVEDDISIGTPFCNTQIYILNSENNICPINIPGEICVAGDGVSLGYINNPERTKKSFIVNPFGEGYIYKTGDIGKINYKGQLKYIDRRDSQIKIRGLRVELSEIEKQILNTIKLKACVVIYKKEKGYISAFIVADEKIDISEMRNKIAQKLPLYMVPKYITQLDKLPLTNNGKVNKKVLETYSEEKSQTKKHVEPRTEREKLFCSIWTKLLNTKIGLDDDVFENGADSLIAIKFKTELLSNDVEVPYADLFKYKTVRSFCENSNIKEIEAKEEYDYTNINKILEKNNIRNLKNIECKKNNNILLLGATGFVGMHIIENFIKNDEGKIYCIVRDKNNKSAQERFTDILHFYFGTELDKYLGKRIIALKGNIFKENFDLSNKNYKNLIDEVNIVINSAAIVKHYGEEQKILETNVNSTKNIINFCIENQKRLLHLSTLSVSGNSSLDGEAQDREKEFKMTFTETELYKGQNLSNTYLKSKFIAERAILENIENGLDAQILRLGNITSRLLDGVFQINPQENAFACKIRSMIKLGMIPEYLLKEYMEFTPVDICAEAIIRIMQNNQPNFSVYHIYDNEHVHFDEFIKYLKESNIELKVVEHQEFKEKINDILKNNSNDILSGIINDFDKDKKLTYTSNVDIVSEFTRAFLYKIGFIWPKINEEYIQKYIRYLSEIKFL